MLCLGAEGSQHQHYGATMICSSSVALLKGGQSIAEASEGLIGQQLDLLASVLHQRLKQGDPKH